MVDINNIVDTILNDLNIPFYCGMPEFGETDQPEKYLVYDVGDIPAEFAEGDDIATEYIVTVNIFSPFADNGLKQLVKSTMKANGFIYAGGNQISDDKTFPFRYQYYQDYKINFMEE